MNISIINLAAMADILWGTPIISHIRKKHSDAHITWMIRDSFLNVAVTNPDVDAFLPIELPNRFGDRQKDEVEMFDNALKLARSPKWDKVYNIQYFPYFQNFYENPNEDFVSLRARNCGLNLMDQDRKVILNTTYNDKKSINEKFPNQDWSKTIALNHIAYAMDQYWTIQDYDYLCTFLTNSMGYHVICAGSLNETLPQNTQSAQGTTFREWCEIISRSKLYVGNDSGGIALAAATNTPIIKLHNFSQFPLAKTGLRSMGLRQDNVWEISHVTSPRSVLRLIQQSINK